MQNRLSTVGRIVFALPFLLFGASHFLKGEAKAAVVPIPGGVFWVYLTGAAMIAASLGIMTKILGKWAALGLALLMAIFVVFVHVPELSSSQMEEMATMNLLKDIALCGAALSWAGILAREEATRDVRSSTPAHA